MDAEPRIVVARIGAPHGVRGEVRLFPFTEAPETLRTLGPFSDRTGARTLTLAALRPQGDHFVARFAEVDSRDAAELLRNMTLHIPRARLPQIAEDDTFYIADLVGLSVETAAGATVGRVTAVHDFGAGDLLEIQPTGAARTAMVAFTRAMVPVVDLAGGRIVIATADLIAPASDRPDEDSSP